MAFIKNIRRKIRVWSKRNPKESFILVTLIEKIMLYYFSYFSVVLNVFDNWDKWEKLHIQKNYKYKQVENIGDHFNLKSYGLCSLIK